MSLNKFSKIQFIESMFCEHDGIKLEVIKINFGILEIF